MAGRTQKIQKIGNSAGILLPKEWLKQMGLKPGAKVHLEISETRIVIHPPGARLQVKVDEKFAREVDLFLDRNKELLKRLS